MPVKISAEKLYFPCKAIVTWFFRQKKPMEGFQWAYRRDLLFEEFQGKILKSSGSDLSTLLKGVRAPQIWLHKETHFTVIHISWAINLSLFL